MAVEDSKKVKGVISFESGEEGMNRNRVLHVSSYPANRSDPIFNFHHIVVVFVVVGVLAVAAGEDVVDSSAFPAGEVKIVHSAAPRISRSRFRVRGRGRGGLAISNKPNIGHVQWDLKAAAKSLDSSPLFPL